LRRCHWSISFILPQNLPNSDRLCGKIGSSMLNEGRLYCEPVCTRIPIPRIYSTRLLPIHFLNCTTLPLRSVALAPLGSTLKSFGQMQASLLENHPFGARGIRVALRLTIYGLMIKNFKFLMRLVNCLHLTKIPSRPRLIFTPSFSKGSAANLKNIKGVDTSS
jgi:hypothetical protein